MQLTTENYKKGFLVDDETIAGVTEMGEGSTPVFAAYVSHYLTGETYAYQEFEQVEEALAYLASYGRAWAYEAVGCSAKTGKSATSGCGSCSSGGCGK